MKWILDRLREPSTYAGLAIVVPAVISAASGGGDLGQLEAAQILAALAAVLAPEGRHKPRGEGAGGA